MKICTKCGTPKDESEFNWKEKRKAEGNLSAEFVRTKSIEITTTKTQPPIWTGNLGSEKKLTEI